MTSAGRGRAHGALVVALALGLLVCVVWPAGLSAASQDAAATHSYVVAKHSWYQAVVANFPQSTVDAERFASEVASDCPGVLANATAKFLTAPRTNFVHGTFVLLSSALGEIEQEVRVSLGAAWLTPDVQATTAFVSVSMSLHWNSPGLTTLVRDQTPGFAEPLGLGASEVCADMNAWRASGYTVLPPRTKALAARISASVSQIALSTLALFKRPLTIGGLLASSESSQDRALVVQTDQLVRELNTAVSPGFGRTEASLMQSLGVVPHRAPREPAGRTLARGRVPGGSAFSIVGMRERLGRHVQFSLEVRFSEQTATTGEVIGGGSEGAGRQVKPAVEWQEQTGCSPHPYLLVYGVLRRPRDTVLRRVSGRLTPLQRVSIPSSLHSGGVLVYAVMPLARPTLYVREPSGRTTREPATLFGNPAADTLANCRRAIEGDPANVP